jgi:CheY-like chemotaxis protein
MGLSLCKEIVGFMGGALDVQSKLGYGSTFTVTLPALYEASASVHPLAALEAGVLGVVAYHEVIQRTVSRMTANWGLKPVAWNLAGRSLRLPDADVWFVEYQADATHTAHVARTILNHAAPERPVMIAMLPPGTTLAPADKALFDVVIEKPLRRKALHEALHFGLLSQTASGEDAEGTYTEATERQIRLLMIEPNRINQKILARMLENLDVTVDTAMALDEIAAEWPNRGYDAILVNAASHSQASLDELREFAWSVQKPGGPRLIALLTGESKITSEMLRAAGISHQLMMPVNLEAMREALGLDH